MPFWSDGLRFECQQSGRCCTSRGEYGFVYLTETDAARLAAHLGLERSTFERQYCERTDGWLHLKGPDEDCAFLDGTRCGVYEARPEQCRTWPFWPENVVNARVWRREVERFCPGVGKGRLYTGEEIARILAEQEK